jgi:HEAT repeat protein
MSRKSKTITSKAITSEKKFSAVPPKATAAAAATAVAEPVKAQVAATAVAAPVAAPAVVAPVKAAVVTKADAIKPLLAALHDVNADIAREAATSLGLLGDAGAVEPLIQVVKNSNQYFHSVVRSAAAVSLGQLKDRRAVEALLDAVNDPIADPSTEAIRALVSLADPRAINALVEVVRNSSNFFAGSVRRAAVLGLAKLGGDTAVAELRRVAADSTEDSVIRDEATAAIKSHKA